MKITIYELLGMIKDGKAPKEIKYDDYLLSWDNVDEDYYCENYGNLFEFLFTNIQTTEVLNNEVVILVEKNLEEEKEIPEKLNMTYMKKIDDDAFITERFSQAEQKIVDTVNTLIDYLKSKGE